MMAAVTPLTFAFRHPDWAVFYTFAIPYNGVPLAVGVWLIRTARRLQAARLALAEEAIVRERLRIERELGQTVGTALESIAERGDRAASLAMAEPGAATWELSGLVGTARGTLAEARRMITRYRDVSLRAELETAVTLLEAAGIRTRLLPAPLVSSAVPDEERRAALRRDIARLLHEGAAGGAVNIVVAGDGRVRFESGAGEVPTPP
jgi:two-component system, NarL family, sensor histidine kinase DesK